ncbi:MAG: TRAP transporter large permease subunit [Butyricicoccus sp.]|nr:TRAP transporter large permease subunit [Butyricicoccus sp.]
MARLRWSFRTWRPARRRSAFPTPCCTARASSPVFPLQSWRLPILRMLMDCLVSAAKSSSVIMFLAAAAMVSSWMMTVANIPATVTTLLNLFLGSPILLMLVICILVLLVGTSMDVTPTIMILTPVLLPAIKAAGIDPAYFGVVFIIVTVMGLLTPPVGTVLNVACSAGRINMERIVKAIWPFLVAEVVILILMVLFPQIVTVPMNFFTGG